MTDLLPCPFCGGRGDLRHHDDWGVEYGCYACQFGLEARTDALARAAWNRRAMPDELRAEATPPQAESGCWPCAREGVGGSPCPIHGHGKRGEGR